MSTTIDGSASVTINSGAVLGITSGTAVASTSGTSIDFTSIPSWVKRITVMFNGVSTSGASNLLIQIGSASFTTSGYLSAGNSLSTASDVTAYTTGFGIRSGSAGNLFHGQMTLCLLNASAYVWISSHGGSTTTNNTDNYFKVNFTFSAGIVYRIISIQYGINQYYTTPVVATINDLINDFNSVLGAYGVFSYEVNGSAPNYTLIIKGLDPTWDFDIFETFTPVFTANFNTYIVQKNSTVVITTGTSITYGELLSELQNQPYIINSINVYANTQTQSMQRLKKIKRTMSGVSATDFNRPRIDPMQSQFAIEHIDANFTPSPINILNYNMKGLESVRMWFYYNRIDISEMNQKKFNEIIESKTINKMIKITKSINPLFDLVGTKQERQITIKEKLAPTIENRDVTDEEVYNSFDGLDFKELE
jgi:hypothetical protein